MQQADRPWPLIGVAELAALGSAAEPPVIFDARWRLAGPPGSEMYRNGHLPGAVFADLDTDLAGPPSPGGGGRHPLPDPAAFQAAMRAAGLNSGQLAVCYDDSGGTPAARLWWLLRHHGHDQVRLLDGGLGAWSAAGLPVVTEVPHPGRGNFTAQPGRLPVLDADGAAALAAAGVLLDARAPERYRGETEPVDPVAGHIPGAVSAFAAANLRPDGTFLDPSGLRARFLSLGVPAAASGPAAASRGAAPSWRSAAARPAPAAGPAAASEPASGPHEAAAQSVVGTYCGSGVVAAQQVLALELAGWPGAALYVGSWSDWVSDPARPVATGPDPG